nr:MAG TPA: hypothetical protein [Inoviridae sp.]
MTSLHFNLTPDETKAFACGEYSFVPMAASILSRVSSPAMICRLLDNLGGDSACSFEDFCLLQAIYYRVYGDEL